MEYLLPYLSMVTVPHIMVRLERMLDYRGVRLARFHCTYLYSPAKYKPIVLYVCLVHRVREFIHAVYQALP